MGSVTSHGHCDLCLWVQQDQSPAPPYQTPREEKPGSVLDTAHPSAACRSPAGPGRLPKPPVPKGWGHQPGLQCRVSRAPFSQVSSAGSGRVPVLWGRTGSRERGTGAWARGPGEGTANTLPLALSALGSIPSSPRPALGSSAYTEEHLSNILRAPGLKEKLGELGLLSLERRSLG